MAITYLSNITSETDYIGEYALSFNTYSEETFDSYITQKEYELLVNMLGASLYNTYAADPATAEWVSLRDGEAYTATDGYTYNWQGIKDMIIRYIHASFILDNQIKTVQSGTVKNKFENADTASEYDIKTKAYKSWNMFVERYMECRQYLEAKNSDDNSYDEYYVFWRPYYKKGLIVKGSIS